MQADYSKTPIGTWLSRKASTQFNAEASTKILTSETRIGNIGKNDVEENLEAPLHNLQAENDNGEETKNNEGNDDKQPQTETRTMNMKYSWCRRTEHNRQTCTKPNPLQNRLVANPHNAV
ncbi:Uncharacterized protein Fot_40006 [Forsythia ovata]|uniref:Uncharacterized protein n=1 Tax=Forsythia ovata TaxID=205694 RepID=A0ABD1S672_9LAMI